jgi:hypothetical protein
MVKDGRRLRSEPSPYGAGRGAEAICSTGSTGEQAAGPKGGRVAPRYRLRADPAL